MRQDEVPEIIDARKMYVVVRGDLPEGLRAAQAAHAVAEMCMWHPERAIEWNRTTGGNYLIILEVPDERQLLDWKALVKCHGIHHELFREPDLRQEATAFAALPHPDLNDVFSPLPLAYSAKVSIFRHPIKRLRGLRG